MGGGDSPTWDDAARGVSSAQRMLYSVYAVYVVCCTRCMVYSVYAVHGACCTRCMLYSVYAVLGVCCIQCMMYSVYALLSVCCCWCMLCVVYAELGEWCIQCMPFKVYAVLGVKHRSWHGGIESDDLMLCFQLMVVLMMRKTEIRGHGGYEYEKWGLERILCASQFTITDIADTSTNLA